MMMSLGIGAAIAQKIEMSPPQKLIGKYDDYEILGTNSIGTIVHYYSKGNHKIQVFNSGLRPFNEIELLLEEKRSTVEKILLSDDLILVFYSVVVDNTLYLKVKRINYRLDASKEGLALDSIKHNVLDSNQKFFVKPSLNNKYYVAFSFEDRINRLNVHYSVMDPQLKVLKTGDVLTEDKNSLTLESVKVNNSGDLLITVGHLNRRSSDEDDFSFAKFSNYFIPEESNTISTTTIVDDEFLFKDLVTNWDELHRTAVLVGTYQRIKDVEDVGVFYTAVKGNVTTVNYKKMPFVEEDFVGSNAPYRRWNDNAEIQIPKRIIPRSDGGFIYLLEAEYHQYHLLPMSNTTTNYPSVPMNPAYSNYYDENYYYDIKAVSVDAKGNIDWKINLPKRQETENDLGRYSSYFYFSSNNVSKLLFVDDVYGNGNLSEYNFNPNGKYEKKVLLNSYRDDLLLVIKKGIQISGNEVIIPSEKKAKLRLVKITF
jgi:hypothetical protein